MKGNKSNNNKGKTPSFSRILSFGLLMFAGFLLLIWIVSSV